MIFFSLEEIKDEENLEKLIEIFYDGTQYQLKFKKFELDETGNISTRSSSWFVFKLSLLENKNDKYKINIGDIIKIGRITARIKEVKFENKSNEKIINGENNVSIISEGVNNLNNINNFNYNEDYINYNKAEVQTLRTEGAHVHIVNEKILSNNNNNSVNKSYKDKEKDKSKIYNKDDKNKNRICRICYIEEEDEYENPLLQPCICSGSMKFIHFKCLKQWINTKCYSRIEYTEDCEIYLIKQIKCELCNSKLPDIINHKGLSYNLTEFIPGFNSYLILESLTLDKHKNKFNYVVNLEQNKVIKIGRAHDSQILFSDISVSRTHCVMTLENRKIYIEDNDATFGTLVLIQTGVLNIEEGAEVNIQVGRTFLKLKTEKKIRGIFNCCGVEEKGNCNAYQKQNEKYIKYKNVLDVRNQEEIYIESNKKIKELSNLKRKNKNRIIKKDKDKSSVEEDKKSEDMKLINIDSNTNNNNKERKEDKEDRNELNNDQLIDNNKKEKEIINKRFSKDNIFNDNERIQKNNSINEQQNQSESISVKSDG